MPIDRVYIEDFLSKNRDTIKGVVCEIADDSYSKKFGSNVEKYEILQFRTIDIGRIRKQRIVTV